MLELFRMQSERSGRDEVRRRYRVLSAMYLNEDRLDADQIAEREMIDKRTVYKDIDFACERLSYIDCHGPVNWSTWKEDMIEISRMFPDVRFRLAGSCDYPDDNWHSYFENGKVEECNAIITYEQPVEIRWDKEVF